MIVTLQHLISHSPLPLYLSIQQFGTLARCSSQLQELISKDDHFDENAWRAIYRRDFYQIKGVAEDRVWRDQYRTMLSSVVTRRTEEYIQKHDGPLQLMDEWGAAVLMHGRPLAYVWPVDHVYSIDKLFVSDHGKLNGKGRIEKVGTHAQRRPPAPRRLSHGAPL